MNVPNTIENMVLLVIAAFAGKTRIGPVPIPASSHSIRVMFSLLTRECPVETALAGGGHDLFEDTFITPEHVTRIFGQRVCDLVQACTIDPKLGDTPEGEEELYERNIKIAESGDCESLMIKCEDSLDNLKTNRYLKPDWQVSQFRRGMRWAEAANRFDLPLDLELDLKSVLSREANRLQEMALL